MAWRWSNVPIPEVYLGALVGAAVMHFVMPIRLPLPAGAARVAGATSLAAGVGLAAWAVRSAGDADVESNSELVTSGAYAHSRNPMYVGWSAAVAGIAVARRDPWLLAGWVVASRILHGEILREESRLAASFGKTYAAYRSRVPRYLVLHRRRAATRLG